MQLSLHPHKSHVYLEHVKSASDEAMAEDLYLESVVRSHHVSERVWTPFLGEQLMPSPEDDNKQAVAVLKDMMVVSHVLWGIKAYR